MIPKSQLTAIITLFLLCGVEVQSADTDIYELHIISDISYRFATTQVTSKIANTRNYSAEISFNVQLPKAAFIANFSMEIDGVVYPGDVKEKEQARRQYEKAKKKGQSAGHVAASPRDTNKFNVAVNVAARSKVTFDLTYQELLERRLGVYEHVININPGQPVRDLQILVNIHESREITLLRVPPLRNDISNFDISAENDIAVIEREASNKATIRYTPSKAEQEAVSALGLSGQFLVQYDVARARDGGEIQVVDGYFVHFFAPQGVQVGDKAILFILDTSGSMAGQKMEQVHDAMTAILDQLRPGDYFNIIEFSSNNVFWRPEMASATDENIRLGKEWARSLAADGWTNINQAVTEGIRHVGEHIGKVSKDRDKPLSPLILFLTDGLPSAGEQNTHRILENVEKENEGGVTVFSLGFGNDVDFNFLTKMALQNDGFARKIYADSSASVQLQGFYQEVASPLLSDVTVEYLNDGADNSTLTNNKFHTYFRGTELVIAGSLTDIESNTITAQISGNSAEGPLVFNMVAQSDQPADLVPPSPADLQDNIERMWAYLTIKEILKKRIETDDKEEKDRLKQKALDLSLKYNFVTSLTSMVVTKPEEPAVAEDVDEDTSTDIQDAPPLSGVQNVPQSSKRISSGRRHKVAQGPPARRFADNDPHFVVEVAGSERPICFDVMGEIGDIYQLLHDPQLNFTINGLVIGKRNEALKKQKTYFGTIGLTWNDTKAVISPHKIRVNRQSHKWKRDTIFRTGQLSFHMERKNVLRIHVMNKEIKVVVMRHLVAKNHTSKVDFMGIYFEEETGLSESPYGLLGQFRDLEVRIQENKPDKMSNKTTATMTFPHSYKRKPVTVYEGKRLNMASKEHTTCWFVRNNGHLLLDGKVNQYKVPNILYNKLAPELKSHFLL